MHLHENIKKKTPGTTSFCLLKFNLVDNHMASSFLKNDNEKSLSKLVRVCYRDGDMEIWLEQQNHFFLFLIFMIIFYVIIFFFNLFLHRLILVHPQETLVISTAFIAHFNEHMFMTFNSELGIH